VLHERPPPPAADADTLADVVRQLTESADPVVRAWARRLRDAGEAADSGAVSDGQDARQDARPKRPPRRTA
jgi:hypothetical protein